MPNWCSNKLTLRHADSAMIDRAVSAFSNGALFNEFVPCPVELQDTMSGFFSDESAQSELDAKRAENVTKFGYSSWYDFNIANWGTKWDVGSNDETVERNDVNTVTLHFDTAWAPPIDFYHALVSQDFEVEAMYNEFGMGFCGEYFNGSDSYIEYGTGNMDDIPDDIDAEFGIREILSEWAED